MGGGGGDDWSFRRRAEDSEAKSFRVPLWCDESLFVVRLQFISFPISLIDMVRKTVIRHDINMRYCGGKSRSYMKAELSLTFS